MEDRPDTTRSITARRAVAIRLLAAERGVIPPALNGGQMVGAPLLAITANDYPASPLVIDW